MDLQKAGKIFATGMYQIIPKTLKEIVKLTKYEYNFRSFNNELKIKF
jgi:hypothetical protein